MNIKEDDSFFLHQNWISGKDPNTGRKFELTCGAARNALINTHQNTIADDLLAAQRAFFGEEEDLNY